MNASSTFESDIRNLRMRISVQAEKMGIRALSLVGTHPGAGATTLCVQLGRDLADDSRVVIVMDADVQRPRIHERFRVPQAPGAAQVASGQCTLVKALHRISERLFVLTSGTWPAEATGCSAEAWSRLVHEARSAGDLVLLDAGSVGQPSTSATLAAGDATVIVAEAGRSRWEQVAAVADRLHQLKIPVLGVVLNRRRYPIPGFIYKRL